MKTGLLNRLGLSCATGALAAVSWLPGHAALPPDAPMRQYAIEIAPDAGMDIELAAVLETHVAVDWLGPASDLVRQLATQLGLPYSSGGAGSVEHVAVHQSAMGTVSDAMRTINAQLPPTAIVRLIRTISGYRLELTGQDAGLGHIEPVAIAPVVPANAQVNAGSTAVAPNLAAAAWGADRPSDATVYQEATPGRSALLNGPGIEPESQSSANWVRRARARWTSQIRNTP